MLWLILGLTSLCTAALSAIFGMVGGTLLMGVYTALLPVPLAMVMHGATQLLSNVARAVLLRGGVYWHGVWLYFFGAGAAFAALYSVHWLPPAWLVFLGLGVAPFAAALLPARWFDFQQPRAAVATGCAVAAMQLTAGAAGPLLDIAFVDTRLTREQIVATKAVTQCFSHTLKLLYFLPLLERGDLQPALWAPVFVTTIVGTKLGTSVLRRMTDAKFKRYSRAIVYTIGAVYIGKASLLLW